MIEQSVIEKIVRNALEEDIGHGDVTTNLTVDQDAPIRAEIGAKQDLVSAGIDVARAAFRILDPSIEFTVRVQDGTAVSAGQTLAEISGPARPILTAERVALNFMMRLSGVATLTSKFVKAVQGTQARIVDTRKTTPGYRVLEKAAVRAGGGSNHRFALYDGILIKDNHIAAAGSITNAVQKAQKGAPHGLKVEVEVEDLEGLREAISAGADIVMLDNMAPEMMRRAVDLAGGKVLLEASGGVNLKTVAEIAACGVDLISVGALTHSAPAVDISLNFLP